MLPANLLTAYGCLLFFETLSCTKLTTSGLMGALKIVARATVSPVSSFFSLYTETNGRAVDKAYKYLVLLKRKTNE